MPLVIATAKSKGGKSSVCDYGFIIRSHPSLK